MYIVYRRIRLLYTYTSINNIHVLLVPLYCDCTNTIGLFANKVLLLQQNADLECKVICENKLQSLLTLLTLYYIAAIKVSSLNWDLSRTHPNW